MPRSALPAHLQNVEANFPDDDQFAHIPIIGPVYRWINKKTKTWFAFSYRCTEWWAKWRIVPKTVWSVGGAGPWRYEHPIWGEFPEYFNDLVFSSDGMTYLSRIQYWKRWSIIIQWPFMFSFHWYPKAADVPKYREPRPDLDGKVWFAYWNHFDADLIYWMLTSAYIGRNFK